ncbi:MAG: DUF4382 domain-containing protein [Bacteroidales bacterium]|nr:DUF4382 domain-containing protein [Bacteroidales bacterium]
MKSTSKLLTVILIALLSSTIILSSCSDDDEQDNQPATGTAEFDVALKSSNSKSTYDAIYIDIQKVSIHTSSDSAEASGWFELETNIGIYDLLDYESGNDTIIAFDSLLQVQTISQIRLILGENNTIIDDGVTYDLETPSAQTSGLKLQVHAELEPDKSYKLLLNFDADNSINKTGNGKYKLTPVINTTLIEE